jgi:NAD-dependent dihydropyrimidine dehydrogenase PreA subunit
MKDRDSPDVNNDHAPEADKWKGTPDADILAKWKDVNDGHKHFADKHDGSSGGISVGVNGSACILCQACLIECEGECIVITDDAGTVYRSIYK